MSAPPGAATTVPEVAARSLPVREVHPAEDGALAARLLALQRAAYALEAALLGDDRIPPLHESLDELRRAPLCWLAALDGDEPLGALAFTADAHVLDIHRLVVAPAAHRRGVGTALVSAALRGAGERATVVATGRDNAPARRLYERLGFRRAGDDEVLPGLVVTRYVRSTTP